MSVANVRPLFRRRFALLAPLAEHLASTVIGVPRLRRLWADIWAFRAVLVFHHYVFQFRRLPILAILAICASALPHPLGLNYDSKGVTQLHPKKSM
jgi:hypothetical protein